MMSMPVNVKTFNRMVDEDIEWLKNNAPESFIYRDHIESCLEMAKRYYAEVHLPSLDDSEWNC